MACYQYSHMGSLWFIAMLSNRSWSLAFTENKNSKQTIRSWMKVAILYTLTALKESWWHELFVAQSCSGILWFSVTNKTEMRQYAWPQNHLSNGPDIWWCTDTEQSFDCFNLYTLKIRKHICSCRKIWWWCSQCTGYTFLRKTSLQPCRLRHSVLITFQH